MGSTKKDTAVLSPSSLGTLYFKISTTRSVTTGPASIKRGSGPIQFKLPMGALRTPIFFIPAKGQSSAKYWGSLGSDHH